MRVHYVMGYKGEVGAALYQVLKDDNPQRERIIGYDIIDGPAITIDRSAPATLHVCIGWSTSFAYDVDQLIEAVNPDLVVVHSTVPVGTCDIEGWVHSPIRGRHPNLADGIRMFTKHFAGARAAETAVPFTDRGIPAQVHSTAATTELGKLTELVQYGVEIAMMRKIADLCSLYEVPFDDAYTAMSRSYNDGFARLGHRQFTKPVLDPMPGPVGGHCIKQAGVAMIGHEFFDGLLDPLEPDRWAQQPADLPLPGEAPLW